MDFFYFIIIIICKKKNSLGAILLFSLSSIIFCFF